jgi:hypothetical protein
VRRTAQLIEEVLGRYIGTIADPSAAAGLIVREPQDLADAEIQQTRPYKNCRLTLSNALNAGQAPAGPGAPAAMSLATKLQNLQTRNRSFRIVADTHVARR